MSFLTQLSDAIDIQQQLQDQEYNELMNDGIIIDDSKLLQL